MKNVEEILIKNIPKQDEKYISYRILIATAEMTLFCIVYNSFLCMFTLKP